MNIWENENIFWYPDDKNLGLFSQTFKRQYHPLFKNTDPMAMVFLVTSCVVLGALHFLSLSFLSCDIAPIH